MNDLDFKMIVTTMQKLWPRSIWILNDEQRNIFWMACGDHTAAQCIAVMRDHAVKSPYAIKPADLWKRLRERREDKKSITDETRIERRAKFDEECAQMTLDAEMARGELSELETSVFQHCKRRAVEVMVTLRGFIAPPGDRHSAQERSKMIDMTLDKLSDNPQRWSDFVALVARSAILEEAEALA